jgi:hypothetical protein
VEEASRRHVEGGGGHLELGPSHRALNKSAVRRA